MTFLVGDIGGTNTRLAIFEADKLVYQLQYRNRDMKSLESCLEAFLVNQATPIQAAVFGAAGPVDRGHIKMTNLDWVMDERRLSSYLNVPVRLLNDFHIQALGTVPLGTSDYESLGDINVKDAVRLCVIGAGTGLGEAILIKQRHGWVVVPGEGGHKRFAPKNEREITLLRTLNKRWPGHVSMERIVSGPGLINVYDAFRGTAEPHTRMATEDPAAVISDLALKKACQLCSEVLNIFVDTLADEAANLALQSRAEIVYVSGGIPVRILPIIRERFRNAFEAKGRYRALLEKVEIRIVNRPQMALEGAALAAAELVGR